MENNGRNHDEKIISFFDQEIRWWTDVYRDDLPRGFFSFEMRRRLKLVAELLTAQIQKMDNPEVLECGCGPGDILALVAPLQCKLTGLDLNQRYLDLAKEKVPSGTFIEGNVECLPFPDDSFDIVYAVGVFLYLKDDQLAAKEIARVTKNGGFVLISNPNLYMMHLFLDPYYVFRFVKKLLGVTEKPSSTEFDDSSMRRYPLSQFRDLFRKNGLHEIRSMCTSFGPLKFWRREVLPLATSIRISEKIRDVSERRRGAWLRHAGNHLILTLRKG